MAQVKLKDVFKVESVHKAFYTGGSVQWTTEGTELLCQCGGNIQVLDVEQGKVTAVIGQEKTSEDVEEDEQDTVLDFIISDDNETVVIAHKSGLFKEWRWKEKKLVKMWKSIHKGPVARLAVSHDSTLLATGGTDSSVRVWDLLHHACTHNLVGLQGVVSVLAFREESNGTKRVFAAADDTTIRAWNLKTSKVTLSLAGHFSTVTGFAFHQNNKHLVSCSRDKVIILWDLVQGKQLYTIPVYESLESVVILPDKISLPGHDRSLSGGVYVAVAGEKGVITVWDTTHKSKLFTQTDSKVVASDDGGLAVTKLLFNSTKQQLAVISADHNIILHELDTLSCVKQFIGFSDEILDIAYVGPKESHIAVATNSQDIKLYNAANMSCQLLQGHTDLVVALSTSGANPCLLASGAKDRSIRVWLLMDDSAKCVAVGTRHTASVTSVGLSRLESSFIVSAGQDTTLKLWNLPKAFSTEQEDILSTKLTAIAHDKDINSLCVSPNDKLIATASLDKTAKLWSTADLSLVGVFKGHRRGVWSVCFSPVDQVLLTSSADCTVKLWSLSDLSCIKTLEGHDSSVMSAQFVTRGMQVVSVGGDGLLKLWNIKTSECIKTFEHHDGKIWALVVSNDEERLITGGADSQLVVWKDVTEETMVEASNARQERVLQEQQLANLMNSDKLLPALKFALNMEKPAAVYKIIEGVLKKENFGLSETISKLREDQKLSLLKCATVWNGNSKHCHVAQVVISILLDNVSDGSLQIQTATLESLLPYTDRHFKRMTQLLQDLHFLQYTATIMQPHSK